MKPAHFLLTFLSLLTRASVVLWAILSARVRFLPVKIRLHVTCSLHENIVFRLLRVVLRSGLFMFEECAANLQVLPSLCPTQQTGNLSHLPGFLCLDLSNALQSFLIFFFTVYVILVVWLCLNFFYLSKRCQLHRLAVHLITTELFSMIVTSFLLCISVLYLSQTFKVRKSVYREKIGKYWANQGCWKVDSWYCAIAASCNLSTM